MKEVTSEIKKKINKRHLSKSEKFLIIYNALYRFIIAAVLLYAVLSPSLGTYAAADPTNYPQIKKILFGIIAIELYGTLFAMIPLLMLCCGNVKYISSMFIFQALYVMYAIE